jgi:hypothetical protein
VLVVNDSVTGIGTLEAAAGSTLDLKGGGALTQSMSGAGAVRLDGSTPFTFANGTANAGTLVVGSGATLSGYGTISSIIGAPGTLIANGGTLLLEGTLGTNTGPLQATAGSVLDLQAASALDGPITGAGTLQLDDAVFHCFGTTTLSMAKLQIDAGASLLGAGTISSAVSNGGTVEADDGKLVLSGAVSGTGTLMAESGEVLDLIAGGTLTEAVSGAGTLELGGAYTLGTTGPTITTVQIDASASLSGAGTITSAVTNSGMIIGSGTALSLLGTVTNSGLADAATGLLTFQQSVGGTGTLDLGSSGTLSLLLGAGSGQVVDFLGTTGLLDLTNPLDFAGTIIGFGGSDQIDLLSTAETTFSYASNVLTVKNGSTTVATLDFTGSSNSFSLSSDGHSGTLITVG